MVLLTLERPLALAAPEREHLVAFLAAQPRSNGEERAINDRAVVVGEFNQSSLRDEPAELN